MFSRPHAPPARHGNLVVLVALLLTGLIGVLAIAVDGGLLQDNKRRVQAAADAAALAAADQLFRNYPLIGQSGKVSPDPGNKAQTAAFASAAENGFANNGTTSTVAVNIPPKSGPFTGRIGHAEVIITYQQPRYFSTIWGSTSLPVVARSVSRGRWAGTGNGVIVLDPSQSYALDASGNGTVTVTGGAAMVVNSADLSAARTTGGGQLTSAQFRITGNYTGTLNGPVQTGVTPTPDPLAYLPAPAEPVTGSMTRTSLTQGNSLYTLTPGKHTNLPTFNPGDIVVLKQASTNSVGGIYYIDGGGFNSTGANIIMDPFTSGGVMIYNNPRSSANSQQIQIKGNDSGTVNLGPLASGPYAGILFWQARASDVPLAIAGNGNFTLRGTFYAANAQLQITGNGTATIGSQYISRTLSLSGGGNINIDYSEDTTAKLRDIRLVE